jgi:hypothetical protein
MESELATFRQFGKETVSVKTTVSVSGTPVSVKTFINEFWTSKQRAAHSLHEVSYRACFKPQLPRFFIERLTKPGDRVYDPFMGRGTTLLETALLGRVPLGCDINPLSKILIEPRLCPPRIEAIAARLKAIDFQAEKNVPNDLLVFYHRETLEQICSLKNYFLRCEKNGTLDPIDRWIQMVAVNRLTGHSPGFFSVYTLPPNQAVSINVQKKINQKRGQSPVKKNVSQLIFKKTRALLADGTIQPPPESLLLTSHANDTPQLPDNSVSLVVTSPPFLDVVDYAQDNWLRSWFCGIDPRKVKITMARKVTDWAKAMEQVFRELERVLKPGGHVAFEVGEIRKGRVRLEEIVIPCGMAAGLQPRLVLINDQTFTKTSHCWGVANNNRGTNTNRIVLFQKNFHDF